MISLPAKTLGAMASACARISPSKSHTLALTSTLISVNSDSVEMTATDALNSLRVRASAACIGEGFSLCVDSKKFSEAIKAMPQTADVSLSLDGDQSAPLLVVAHGKSKIKLPALAAAEFPEPMPMDKQYISVNYSDLAPLLKGVSYAASDDPARANLNGVYLHNSGAKLVSAATDGHRLATATSPQPVLEGDLALSAILTKDSVHEVLKGEYTRAEIGAQYARFIHEGEEGGTSTTYMCRLLNEKFPPYQAVIPKSNTLSVRLSVSELKSALTRMMVIADDKTHAVLFVFSTDDLGLMSLHLESKNDHGVTKEQVEVTPVGGEVNGSIAFSVKYLQDALSRVSSPSAIMCLNPALSGAAIVHDDGPKEDSAVLSVVMPRRS